MKGARKYVYEFHVEAKFKRECNPMLNAIMRLVTRKAVSVRVTTDAKLFTERRHNLCDHGIILTRIRRRLRVSQGDTVEWEAVE